MSERIWDRYLTDEDRKIMAGTGWGARAGFGKRPVLLVIDVSYGFCGEKNTPISECQSRWPLACGPHAWEAVDHIKSLVEKAHEKKLPVLYTTGSRRPDNWDSGSWAWKNANSRFRKLPKQMNRGHHTIVDEIAPSTQDIVVYKQKPSAFFGTSTASFLTLLGCDSIIVTGTTTSGCIRATVIDAFSMNYRVAVAEEACFDRYPISNAINLFDMNAKYADVLPTAEILGFFSGLDENLFELPSGVAANSE